jgi:hypothetical protein
MPRRKIDNSTAIDPIRGGRMHVRTFADGYFGSGNTGPRRQTIDRVVTVTMPAISGEKHKIIPTMEVRL